MLRYLLDFLKTFERNSYMREVLRATRPMFIYIDELPDLQNGKEFSDPQKWDKLRIFLKRHHSYYHGIITTLNVYIFKILLYLKFLHWNSHGDYRNYNRYVQRNISCYQTYNRGFVKNII